jgi:hypothetical protein
MEDKWTEEVVAYMERLDEMAALVSAAAYAYWRTVARSTKHTLRARYETQNTLYTRLSVLELKCNSMVGRKRRGWSG